MVYSSRLYIYGSYIPFNIHVSIPALNTPTKSRFLRIFDHQKSLQGLTSDSSTPMFSLEPTPFCSRRTWMKRRVFGKNFEVKMKVTKRSLKKKKVLIGVAFLGWVENSLPFPLGCSHHPEGIRTVLLNMEIYYLHKVMLTFPAG